MTNREHILNELEGVAPHLVNMPVEMPYHLPEGYFEQALVDALEHADIDGMIALAPTVVQAGKGMPYDLPQDYFNGLADRIMDQVMMEERPTVPQGYFDELPDLLLHRVRAMEVQQELDDVAPVLNTIDKRPVNHVPEGYFEALQIGAQEQLATATPVVPIRSKRGWVRYAVAACVTGIIGFTTFNMLSKTPAALPAENVNIEQELAKMDDATIERYLKAEETNMDANTVAYKPVKDEDIQELLQEFSDEDLQQYLSNETTN